MNNTDADFGLVELDWIDHDTVRFLRLLLCRRKVWVGDRRWRLV